MKQQKYTWQRTLPIVLLMCGLAGLAASFALTYDKLHVLQNPAYQPGCNLSPVLSCGSVMKTQQATVLGVPNTIFGLIAFSMLTLFGMALLAGATFKRWFWLLAQAAATGGVLFMHYLFFQAVWRIHAICPWCFVVWMITIPVFFGLLVYNIRKRHLDVVRWPAVAVVHAFISRHSVDILLFWYLSIFLILLTKFWYYWHTLLP